MLGLGIMRFLYCQEIMPFGVRLIAQPLKLHLLEFSDLAAFSQIWQFR